MNSRLVAAAVSGLVLGLTGFAHAAGSGGSTAPFGDPQQLDSTDDSKHACKGQNACKGKGACKTDAHACRTQNACKGQGGCRTDGKPPVEAKAKEKNSCAGKSGCGSK